MSDNNDAKLYSMSDMNSMAGKKSSAPANVRPVAKKKNAWASDDDAGDLLAGILDETEDAARAEEQERLRALEEKERQRREQERLEEQKRKQEGERRLREEEERRKQAEIRRTGMQRAISGPSPEEIAEQKRKEEEARKNAEVEARIAKAERAQREAEKAAAKAAREAKAREQQRLEALARQAEKEPEKSNTGLIIGIVAALAFVVLLGGGLGVFFMSQDDGSANQTFAKATLEPKQSTTASVEKDFQGVAKPKPVEADDDGASKSKRRSNRRAARRNNRRRKGKKKSKRNFGNVFGGGGGIVF